MVFVFGCLISFSIMPCSSIHVANSKFFYGWVIFHCIYMYHTFFIQLFFDRHLVYFHVLAVINNAAMNIGLYIFWVFLFSLKKKKKQPGVKLLDHMVVVFLVFWDTSILFSSDCTSLQSCWQCTSFAKTTSLLTLVICYLFDGSHSDKCYLIVVFIHISLMISDTCLLGLSVYCVKSLYVDLRKSLSEFLILIKSE